MSSDNEEYKEPASPKARDFKEMMKRQAGPSKDARAAEMKEKQAQFQQLQQLQTKVEVSDCPPCFFEQS